MKKIILMMLFCTFIIASCVSVKYPYINESRVVDYSEYTSKGFYITEFNTVRFEYEAIGRIMVNIKSGYEVLNIEAEKKEDAYYIANKTKIKYGKFIYATPDDAVRELYNIAVESGANGIIDLSINTITINGNIVGYSATGMSIKK
jgi:hypothetical protein